MSGAVPFKRSARVSLQPRGRAGFTLLEVMVAVAILGLGLTAIFAAQAGSFASVNHARNVSEATGLVRCKMSEVEWDLQDNGFQLTDVSEVGACCEGEDNPKMSCSWRVERPEFPEANFGNLDLDSELDLKGGPSIVPGIGGTPGGVGALGFLSTREKDVPKGGDIGDVADSLAGGADSMADGLASLVMGMVYPDLKALFEAGTRRVVVTITWREGIKDHSIELAQWVTNSKEVGLVNMGGLLPEGEEEDDEAPVPPPKKENSR